MERKRISPKFILKKKKKEEGDFCFIVLSLTFDKSNKKTSNISGYLYIKNIIKSPNISKFREAYIHIPIKKKKRHYQKKKRLKITKPIKNK